MIKYGFHAPDMTVTEFVEDLPPVIPKRNLEAWDKIIEEIEQLRARFKESGGVYEHSVYGLDYATEIINKHLNEVKHEPTQV